MIFTAISAGTLLSLALTVASVAYQRRQAKKLKDEMDKRKSVNFSVDGEPFYLSVVYGRGKIAGGKVFHRLRNSFIFAEPAAELVREPAIGSNFDLANYYIKETVTRKHMGGLSEELTFLKEGKADTEIRWAGTLVVSLSHSSTITQYADSSGNIYTKDELVSSTTTGVLGGDAVTVKYFRLYRRTGGAATVFTHGLDADSYGRKKEYLLLQQAICFGGINKIVDVEVDEQLWDEEKLRFGQRIHVYTDGGVEDEMATLNGAPATNTFTNTAFASMVFRLNRDEYNYNGSPNVTFFVEGMLIKDVVKDGETYYLSTQKVYSNNPALVLLDYLTSNVYGLGLDVSQVDLQTFYDAKIICDRVVRDEIPLDGKVNGRRPDVEEEDGTITSQPAIPGRTMPLYECNIVLDTERPMRENVELLLEAMPGSELVWSSGVYKLSLIAPRTEEEVSALIAAELTANDIVREQIDISWPDSSTRLNQVVARFRNEFENFSDDTATWPASYSTVYSEYLAEDNGKLLKTETYLPAVTDPYHALAMAEGAVRASRRAMSVKCVVGKKGLFLEPGDLVSITIPSAGLLAEVMRVDAVTLSSNMTAELEMTQYALETLAWNVSDDITYLPKVTVFQNVPRPTNVIFAPNPPYSVSPGTITWVEPDDVTVADFVIDASTDSGATWTTIGYSTSESFVVPKLATGVYTFAVRSRRDFRYTSPRVIATDVGLLETEFEVFSADDPIGSLVVYGDSGDETTNTQSMVLTVDMTHVAVYTYRGVAPALPIRENIIFVPLDGSGGGGGEPDPDDPDRTIPITFEYIYDGPASSFEGPHSYWMIDIPVAVSEVEGDTFILVATDDTEIWVFASGIWVDPNL